jgi:hypothetical protein
MGRVIVVGLAAIRPGSGVGDVRGGGRDAADDLDGLDLGVVAHG